MMVPLSVLLLLSGGTLAKFGLDTLQHFGFTAISPWFFLNCYHLLLSCFFCHPKFPCGLSDVDCWPLAAESFSCCCCCCCCLCRCCSCSLWSLVVVLVVVLNMWSLLLLLLFLLRLLVDEALD